MLKISKDIFGLLIAATAILGCSQSEDIEVNNVAPVEEKGSGVVFRLETNISSDAVTRTVEDSYEHIQGTPQEYQVNNARVYLYDSPTKLLVKSVLLTDLKRTGTDASGNIIYESKPISVPQGTYDIFVLANTDKNISKSKEDEFLASIDSLTYIRGQITDISNGIVMANRGADNAATVIANTPTSTETSVVIKLERVLARLDIAKSSDAYALTDDNSKQYATVKLDRHFVVNLPKYYYMFRHTAIQTSLDIPKWSLTENFGNVKEPNGYVIDPYFYKKTIDASNFTNQDKYYEHYLGDYTDPNNVSWTTFNPAATTPNYITSYCLENCMLAPAQKNGYSTGVIFDATLEPYNNLYHLNTAGTLELVTDKTKYPEVLYYHNYIFYDSPEALAKGIGSGTISTDDLDFYQAKKFEKSEDGAYHCYYNYWIRHQDNMNNTVMGVMEFAIVRNNLYRMLVTKISGLGNGKLEPDPDTPDEGETKLKVVINVKPWIVRDLTNIVL